MSNPHVYVDYSQLFKCSHAIIIYQFIHI